MVYSKLHSTTSRWCTVSYIQLLVDDVR